MPATYAHWQFGQECLGTMPNNYKKIVQENINIYNIGVHGPDILFYDLPDKEVVDFGYGWHHVPAREIFKIMKEAYHKYDEKPQMMAYILAFLTHFTLDSSLHSYVERKRKFSNITHNLVEAEYEAHCIRQDGKSVRFSNRAKTIKVNDEIVNVLSHFYPFSSKRLKESIRFQHLILWLMNCKTNLKRKILRSILHSKGQDKYSDLIMELNENPICKDSNLRLDKLKAEALKKYPQLFDSLLAYINEDKKLPKYFDHDFDEWPDYDDIPVLSYEEEINYKV